MVLTLYIDQLSQPSRALVIFCRLAKIPFQVHELRIARGEHRKYLRGKVDTLKLPVAQDGDFWLSESHAILRYLCTTRNISDPWYPVDAKTRARVDSTLDWHHTNLRRGSAGLVYAQFLAKLRGMEVHESALVETQAILKSSLQALERRLKQTGWVAGTEQPTIADICLACEAEQLAMINHDMSSYPQVQAWQGSMRKLPEFNAAHAVLDKLCAKLAQSRL